MRSDLAILCVTRAEGYALPFLEELVELSEDLGAQLVICADGDKAARALEGLSPIVVRSRGYIESVLDEAVGHCERAYVLRLDDDERASYPLYVWLLEQHYLEADHWAFPRVHLWPTAGRFITSEPLWPDLQTRLSVKAKAAGRTAVHVGSPYGTGTIAPCAIEHWKFLVRTTQERSRLVEHYETVSPGAGALFVPFSMPERCELETAVYEGAVTTV